MDEPTPRDAMLKLLLSETMEFAQLSNHCNTFRDESRQRRSNSSSLLDSPLIVILRASFAGPPMHCRAISFLQVVAIIQFTSHSMPINQAVVSSGSLLRQRHRPDVRSVGLGGRSAGKHGTPWKATGVYGSTSERRSF